MNAWYLLYCKRREQQRAEQHLSRQGVDCYYPKVRVEKIRRGKCSFETEPLFPNYVFACFNPEQTPFTTVRSTRGVVDFVRQGGKPVVVDKNLIGYLMAHEDNDVQRKALSDVFSPGDVVEVQAGQFAGADAIYQQPDGDRRAILLIQLLSHQVEVSAELNVLKRK